MRLSGALFLGVLLGSVSALAHAAADPVVRVTGGEIRGRLLPGGGATFQGVPYAQPPVGELRWREPVPVKPWAGIRDAGSFGPPCIQTSPNEFYGRSGLNGKEDCLHLNVWTPKWPSKSPKPVMVWLYGGGNFIGAASFDFFDGASLSKRGVVVITLDFRLGAFGLFAHPGLSAESPHHTSGNYSFLDQLAALRWVHDNVAKFGGDPQRITLFGQSSGGMDTSYLVASPLSKGLVQRAIQESGPPIRVYETLAEAEQDGVKLAEALHAPAGAADAVKYMRSLPAEQIEKAYEATGVNSAGKAVVTEIDGYVIREYGALPYQNGQDLPIPMIIGSNAREQSHSYKPDVMRNWVKDNFGPNATEAEAFYGLANGGTGNNDPFFGPTAVQITADTRQRCPAVIEGIWRISYGHPTYEYMWDLPIPGEAFTRHAAEIPFVFGNLLPSGPLGGRPYTDQDKKTSEQIQKYWVNFAETGNPNGEGLPEWPKFNSGTRPYMEFTIQKGPVLHENLRRSICDIYIDGLKETIPADTASAYPR